MLYNTIDWNSVVDVSAWHFEQERAYLEQLAHWGLAFVCEPGVVSMEKDSLLPSASGLELRHVRAILPGGRIVDSSGGEAPIRGSVDTSRLEARTPVWLTIGASSKTAERGRHVSREHPEVRFVQPEYVLSVEKPVSPPVGLQVGELIYSEDRVSLDLGFVPRCLFLDCHPALKTRIEKLQESTRQSLQWLRDNTEISNQGVRCSLMQSLIPVAEVTDWRTRPGAYFERVAWMLKTHSLLLPLAAPEDDRLPPLARDFEAALQEIGLAARAHQYGSRQFDAVEAVLNRVERFYRLGQPRQG